MHDLIKTLRALSDETRLRIMRVLLEKECCVCEIMQALDISQSRASRNLGILQDAGFLTARRDGAWIIYSLDRQTANRYLASLVRLVRNSLADNELVIKDIKRLSRAVRVGPKALNK